MDLLQKLPDRLRGYSNWLPSNWRVIVLVDRDDDDCVELKQRLIAATAAAKLTRTHGRGAFNVIVRIAIEELEAWYFGDWDAVRMAYPKLQVSIPQKAGYRDPDAIHGTWETFERLMRAAGYMQGGLRKTELARELGRRLVPARNTSKSFSHFWNAIVS